ncbi:AAA family ATPase [Kitasatospora phosalacinea]|uniref:AAA family ATPase n=1 Tax=Kitasatospora phosalacinea TaxID=2065 RepID=UPI0035E10BD7
MTTVLVNGLPGAGKSTLGRALAAELGLPLFSKDAVKETLADRLAALRTPDRDRWEWSRALGAAAGETLWTLLRDARGAAVLEAPWLGDPARAVVRAGLDAAGVGRPQEVWCDVPLVLARRRFEERIAHRHPVHPERPGERDDRWAAWARTAAPLALGPVHRVDTTRPVDVPALAAALTAAAALTPAAPVAAAAGASRDATTPREVSFTGH